MVDNHIKRSLNALHINKCNQVDILIGARCFSETLPGDDVPKEEYMETPGISTIHGDDLFTDCVAYANDPDQQLIVGGQNTSIDVCESNDEPYAAEPSDAAAGGPIAVLIETDGNEENLLVIDELVTNQLIENQQKSIALEQLNYICRCCLSDERDLQPLYDNEHCISDMIMAITTIQLSPSDNLPSKICLQCVLQLSSALSFKQQLETADDTLRRFLDQGCHEGVKLVSLGCPDMDENHSIVTTDNEITVAELNPEPIGQPTDLIFEDSSLTDKLINPSAQLIIETFYEKMLGPATIEDLSNGQLLQPMLMQNEMHTESTGKVTSCLDEPRIDQLLPSDLSYDDDPNTLLQPLEMHQLPRNDDDDSADEEDDDKDESDEEDEDMDEDVDMVGSIDGELDKSTEEQSGVTKIEKEYVIGKASVLKEQEFRCALCKMTFSDGITLDQHMRTQLCRQTQAPIETQKVHGQQPSTTIESASPALPIYHCDICALDFSVERDLRIHRSLHRDDGKAVCVECNKECSSMLQLNRHVRTHYADKPHKCAVCEMGFSERGSLTRHFRKHTDVVRVKKHACSFCDKKYYDSHALSVHTRTHTGERPWVCRLCGKSFIDSRLLNSHSKVHSAEKPHACSVCDRRFTHMSTLTTHVRTHTGEKPYVCAMCGKSFIQTSNLQLHMRMHSGEKPFKCEICHRGFVSSSSLSTHARSHTGEKPYQCEICSKSFARNDLTTHMRTHTGEKPYPCTECERMFITSSQLKQHMRRHTGESPFVCKVCNKSCSSAAYLKNHLLAHINAPDGVQHQRTYRKEKTIAKTRQH